MSFINVNDNMRGYFWRCRVIKVQGGSSFTYVSIFTYTRVVSCWINQRHGDACLHKIAVNHH